MTDTGPHQSMLFLWGSILGRIVSLQTFALVTLSALTYPPLAYTYGVLLFLTVTRTPRGLLARLAFLRVFGYAYLLQL